MEEWLKRLPPNERLKQALTSLGARSFIGCQLNGVDSSLSGGGGVNLGEIRVSFIYGVASPSDRQGELILGVDQNDLVSLEHQSGEGEAAIISFLGEDRVTSDTEIISFVDPLIYGRNVAGIDFECPGREESRVCLWLSDGSIIYLNAQNGPEGLPRGRALVQRRGVFIGEVAFTEDSGFHLASSAARAKG